MPRDYKFLHTDEQDERIIATARAQESDHWEHTQNAERYRRILTEPSLDAKWRSRVADLLAQTNSRLAEVESILVALESELPPQARIDAALARLAAKEAAAQAARGR